MTIRPRAARALREFRARMRDAAAASHAAASNVRDDCRDALDAEHARLTDFLDDAPDALAAARTVHDLHEIAALAGDHRAAVHDAHVRHGAAAAAADVTASALRARARQLRTAEKIAEQVERHLETREARAEQRANDDMSARRK